MSVRDAMGNLFELDGLVDGQISKEMCSLILADGRQGVCTLSLS